MLKRHPISQKMVRQLFIIACILFLGYLISKELAPYVSGILGAIIMFVLTKGWMKKMVDWGMKRWLAAGILMFFTFVVVLLPIAGIALLLTNRVKDIVTNSEKYTQLFFEKFNALEQYLDIDITSKIKESNPEPLITKILQGASNNTLEMTVVFGIFVFLLYFMLINFDKIKDQIQSYLPLGDKNFNRISKESIEMVKSNAIAIPMVALCQGIVALIGFWIFDAPTPIFWFAVTTVGSVIPFVGTAIGLVPVVLIMYYQGDTAGAIWLALYGIIVVGSTDNLFRIVVQKSLAEIHPLITLFGMIVGIPLFGFLGLVFGPLLISLFLLFLKIYREEYYDKKFRFWD
ncbi:AI-2E family transporter [Ornithobacterium rhinotracheale]|uniref:AI-2E family transporter n=1 Tax=Ornithobacterium rhinotracheale TaxID=28251 RepID=UPI00129CE25D|nr:AI-2E family transporter [Ornithobacterium rhinotracheale]MRJ09904.1 AI-2E family transporter [Ornithobacterium rhinotracheale]